MDFRETYEKKVVPEIMKRHGYTSPLRPPRLTKIVINIGIGRIKDEKEQGLVARYLALLAGQKPALRPARISIASFKVRKGMPSGLMVTLRGKRMYDFLSRLIDVALPRSRDFRGIDESSIDNSGNLTIGMKEHIAFPEIMGEDVKTIFGLEATIVTNAETREEALEMYRLLGVPLK